MCPQIFGFNLRVNKIVSKYDQEITQSQTAAKPMALLGRATQQSLDTRNTNKAILFGGLMMVNKLVST